MDDYGLFDAGGDVAVVTPPPVAWSPADQDDADIGRAIAAAGNGWDVSGALSSIGRGIETASQTVGRLIQARTSAELSAARMSADRYQATRQVELERYRTDASIEIERIRAQSLARRAAADAARPILPEERIANQAPQWLPMLALVVAGAYAWRRFSK
jgi:hypothetical protein